MLFSLFLVLLIFYCIIVIGIDTLEMWSIERELFESRYIEVKRHRKKYFKLLPLVVVVTFVFITVYKMLYFQKLRPIWVGLKVNSPQGSILNVNCVHLVLCIFLSIKQLLNQITKQKQNEKNNFNIADGVNHWSNDESRSIIYN